MICNKITNVCTLILNKSMFENAFYRYICTCIGYYVHKIIHNTVSNGLLLTHVHQLQHGHIMAYCAAKKAWGNNLWMTQKDLKDVLSQSKAQNNGYDYNILTLL